MSLARPDAKTTDRVLVTGQNQHRFIFRNFADTSRILGVLVAAEQIPVSGNSEHEIATWIAEVEVDDRLIAGQPVACRPAAGEGLVQVGKSEIIDHLAAIPRPPRCPDGCCQSLAESQLQEALLAGPGQDRAINRRAVLC